MARAVDVAQRRRRGIVKEAVGYCAVCGSPALIRLAVLDARLCLGCIDYVQELL